MSYLTHLNATSIQVQHKNCHLANLKVLKDWLQILKPKFDGYEQNGSVKNNISFKSTDTNWMLLS